MLAGNDREDRNELYGFASFSPVFARNLTMYAWLFEYFGVSKRIGREL
jgi:hypothetical protein